MNILKNEKGVTILALTITIIVMIIITGTLIYNANNQLHIKKIDNLYSDIEQIRDKVSQYYIKYGKLPVKGRYCTAGELVEILKQNGASQSKTQNELLDINDKKDPAELTYYVIDLSKLDNLTLYYGSKFKDWTPNVEINGETGEEIYSSSTSEQDLYIINEKSQQIYYPKAITVENKIYYAHKLDLNENNSADLEVTNIQGLSISKVMFENADENGKIYLVKDGKIAVETNITLKVPNDNSISHVYYSILPTDYAGEKNFIECQINEIIEDDDENYNTYNIPIISNKISGGEYYLWIRIIDKDGNENITYKSNENNIDIENKITIEEEEVTIDVPYLSADNTEKQVDVTIKYNAEHLNNVQFAEVKQTEDARNNYKAIKESDPYDIAEDGKRVYTLAVSRDEYLFISAKDQYENEGTFFKTVTLGDFDRYLTEGKIDVVWLDTENNVIEEPNSPVLTKTVGNSTYGLTPVKYNSSMTDHWEEVTNTSEEWYKYIIQSDKIGDAQEGTSRWANARANDGSLFVWIPRYAYKITYYDKRGNEIGYSTNKGIINSRGKLLYETDSNYATSEKVQTAGFEDYIVHPTFTINAENGGGWPKELDGIWFAKFEANYNGGLPQFVAGKKTWINLVINTIYDLGIRATYGGSNSNNILQSHMIKNSEWGAAAYLTHSQYGLRGGNVMINTSTDRYTGGSQDKSVIYGSNIYQSTTHNQYGIYDLVGNTWESTASYINNGSSYLETRGNYVTSPDVDGYTIYGETSNYLYGNNAEEHGRSTPFKTVYSNIETDSTVAGKEVRRIGYHANSKIRGDAVFETSNDGQGYNGWYNTSSWFPYRNYPFFRRGSSMTVNAKNKGVFDYTDNGGDSHDRGRNAYCSGYL